MDPQSAGQRILRNDTVINVAALLQEPIGATRSYDFVINSFPLDDDLFARDLTGTLRLTRVSDALLAAIDGTTSIELECQRCLNQFALPVTLGFDEQFRIAFDVKRGTEIASEIEGIDERPEINENHELDFGEPMRQELILALPMRPVCGPDCPGPPPFSAGDDEDEAIDSFAALAALLEQDDQN